MNSTPAEVLELPAHVPAELRWDHDLDDFPEQFADPYMACDAVHQGPDILWATKGAYRHRPGWVPTRFELLQEIHLDNDRFSPVENHDIALFPGDEMRLMPFESDPPEHTQFRALLQGFFTPAAVRDLEGRIVQICEGLIGKFESDRGCDFVKDFSTFLPSHVFLGLMGMPLEELPQFLAWEEGFMRGSPEQIVASLHAIRGYFVDYLAARRRNPTGDLGSAIANGEVNGRKIPELDAIGACMLLYIGGLDTVKSSLGWYMRHVAQHADFQTELRNNPKLIPQAVNELLRAYAVTCNGRKVVKDTEFHGVQMKAGETVALPAFFASRDAREYENPHVVDIHRKSTRNVTLGTGIHLCLGMHLAKLEMKVVLEQFLGRFDNIHVPEGAKATWTSRGVWGFKSLPLAWN